ncbi:MAG: TIGR02452 family protein [Lachnospiraceae bacterium]|nr:TIGR02452 family protein [Lachnospiraceae bacterium]
MLGKNKRNIEVFWDTVEWINNCAGLKDMVDMSIAVQQLIHEDDILEDKKMNRGKRAEIKVSEKRTLEAAYAYKGKKVCVLNFASAINPGGGVTLGALSQEECLCRCSTLYFNLATDEMENRFYKPHRKAKDPFYNDDIIYSPGVRVIKSDSDAPYRLRESDWYKVNVLTCAAPNLSKIHGGLSKKNEEKLERILRKRIRRIFEVAAKEKNEVLILGAFGCGVFDNPPEIVAKIFRELTDEYEDYFEIIEYAVYHSNDEKKNYVSFVEAFEDLCHSKSEDDCKMMK